MTSVCKIVLKMGRQWMLEYAARGTLLIVALGAVGVLLCLTLNRLVGLPLVSLYAVLVLAVVALGALAMVARARRPDETHLAELLDERTGSGDLFASALEFDRDRARFGWLGELTVDLAKAQAPVARLRPRWSLGAPRQWSALAATAGVLLITYIALLSFGPSGNSQLATRNSQLPSPAPLAVAKVDKPAVPTNDAAPAPTTQAVIVAPDPEPPKPDETVKITNEMIDRYLKDMPQEPVDLTGVTPIRWDEDEVSGKANQQNRPPDEKIDPVKLDAALLKDLQQAKKTKEEGGGKEGGVDVAVMGEEAGSKAKGKEGGKDPKGNLSDAVSKDPRGEPSRMAQRPPLKGFPIRSASRTPTKQKGEDRPMTILDFLAAVERIKLENLPGNADPAVPPAAKVDEHVVRPEALPEDAENLAEAYFAQLRKADGSPARTSAGGSR